MLKPNHVLKIVQYQIGGYEFKNPLLLRQAFTRKSYSEEHGGEDNEVLEFIGDKVLDIAVVRYLAKKYGTDLHPNKNVPEGFRQPEKIQEFHSEFSEGELTKIKQKLVQKKTLARRIDEMEIGCFLIVGEGDKQSQVQKQASVKEDLFEAILGAVALDSDWDFDILQNVVETMLCPDSIIESDEQDYVSMIYEWVNRKNNFNPSFKYFTKNISSHYYYREPNVVYENTFNIRNSHLCNKACQVKLEMDLPAFEGYGVSNNEARKAACRVAYDYLQGNGLLFSIKNEIEQPNLEDAINQLEILARRGYFSIPTYEYSESHDENGNPIWHVECHVEETEYYSYADDSSKKRAKKQAAFDMLNYVLDSYEEE